ncbi:MAG: carbamate kinase [Nanoarchaeota archaeon]
MKKIIVIALGGNALVKKGKYSIKDQQRVIQNTTKKIVSLHKQYNIIITHGNGFQVGNILIRTEEALGKAYALPLEVCVAESEGEIGYLIQQSVLNNSPKAHVVSLLTQVLVDKKDNAFKNPTKPIGPAYSSPNIFKKKKLPYLFQKGKGYRRIVPSPKPIKILEANSIKHLIKKQDIVIAAGGGGIPVIKTNNGYKGVEAVIDKDLASQVLGNSIKAHTLLVLTDVQQAALNYRKQNQKGIDKMTIKQAEGYIQEQQFGVGSMQPKILAGINFLKNGGKKFIITNPNTMKKALNGKGGTHILKG